MGVYNKDWTKESVLERGGAVEVSLLWPHPGCVVISKRKISNRHRSRIYTHIYMNACVHIKSHCDSRKTLRMSTGWSSLVFGQKKSASLSYFWTLKKHQQLLEIFSACAWPSFSMHPGNYGNTEDWWSCWREQWHGYAQTSKQKSISSACWKFRFYPSLWRADVNYESHDYSAIFFWVMLIDLDKVSFFTYKICCIYNK